MHTIKHAIIAAAGMGTRLGLGKPKCLLDFGGEPLIAHLLSLLEEVEDVRIVVGFAARQVIEVVRSIRKDVLFVMNMSYKTTTTLSSYSMGAAHLSDPCLFMDADILFDPTTFFDFLNVCKSTSEPIVALTESKTDDCVYAEVKEGDIVSFSRDIESPYEWANLAWLPPSMLDTSDHLSVFEQLDKRLPLRAALIKSYEVDTAHDFERAKRVFDESVVELL